MYYQLHSPKYHGSGYTIRLTDYDPLYICICYGRTDMRACEVNTTECTCTHRNRLQNTFSDVINRTVKRTFAVLTNTYLIHKSFLFKYFCKSGYRKYSGQWTQRQRSLFTTV